ncbi:metallophosphoesterase [Caldalkalibacillus salinus]|uniref:metallophosphoesterase n=1 Tax=Caldalkalibacillus salinus TaxID=2803787 RepID=UPI0019247336|nr:metallophosphoesterase [Caldalkalibacillus salinus]
MITVIILMSCLVLLMVILSVMYRNAKNIQLRKTDIYFPDWPTGFDGVQILYLSDLHREDISENMFELLAGESIDLILIGGDLTEKGHDLQAVQRQVGKLVSLAPTYFVWGNNDYQNDYRALDIMLRELGVHVLDNRAVSLESGQDRLWLIGLDDCTIKRDDIEHALADVTSPGYRLLLVHNPIIMRKLEVDQGIQAILSGHTHGGQINLPILGPPFSFRSFYRRYLSGQYPVFKGKGLLLISNGVGTSRLPLRLKAEAEIHLLTCRSGR